MAAVATRPSLDQKNLHKKHFRYKISIHAYLVLFCYAVLSLKNNCIFLHLISDHFSWTQSCNPKLCKEPRWSSLVSTMVCGLLLLEELMIWNSQRFFLLHETFVKLVTANKSTTSNLKLISYWNSNLTGTILESSKCNCHLTKTWLKLVNAKHLLRYSRRLWNILVETCISRSASM